MDDKKTCEEILKEIPKAREAIREQLERMGIKSEEKDWFWCFLYDLQGSQNDFLF